MATQATPAKSEVLKSLLRADFTVQWRNRRASILVLLVPLIILVSWKGIVAQFGGPFALASCITFGIVAVGLMGYSNTVARDREKGVFQRLRVTPAAPWQIMTSRLIVQVAQIVVMTIVVFVAGYFVDNIALTPLQYVLTTLMAIVSASVYLGLGQALVGLIASSETLNAVTRLVYFAFIIVGVFGELGFFGKGHQKYCGVVAVRHGEVYPERRNGAFRLDRQRVAGAVGDAGLRGGFCRCWDQVL
jgi:ABC-2 type transport system permease protein